MATILYASVSFVSPLISKSRFGGSFPVGIGPVRKNHGVKFCRASAVNFSSLDADDFRHPLDKQVGPLIFPYHILCSYCAIQFLFFLWGFRIQCYCGQFQV